MVGLTMLKMFESGLYFDDYLSVSNSYSTFQKILLASFEAEMERKTRDRLKVSRSGELTQLFSIFVIKKP